MLKSSQRDIEVQPWRFKLPDTCHLMGMAIFRHARAYDPILKRIACLRPLPAFMDVASVAFFMLAFAPLFAALCSSCMIVTTCWRFPRCRPQPGESPKVSQRLHAVPTSEF